MSFGPAFDAKEQVRQAIDIVDLVGSYVQLRRQGRNFVGLCPWHDDSRPSLQVNPERQSFKCWVCDVGGDVFSFVMKAEGLEFREALELLAERAGISAAANAAQQRAGRFAAPARADDKRTLLPRGGLGRGAVSPLPARSAGSRSRAAGISPSAASRPKRIRQFPSRLRARPLGLAARASPRHASGRRAHARARRPAAAAKSWAAASTIGSAAA